MIIKHIFMGKQEGNSVTQRRAKNFTRSNKNTQSTKLEARDQSNIEDRFTVVLHS